MHLTLESVDQLPSLAERPADVRAVLDYLVNRDLNALSPQLRELALALPVNRFGRDVQELALRYGLNALWERPIEGLLLTGHLYVPPFDCKLVYQWRRGRQRVFIEVFPETRRQDVLDRWQAVEDLLDSVFPGRQERRKTAAPVGDYVAARLQVASGRSLDEIVVQDYDFEETEEETRQLEALRSGLGHLGRVERAQTRTRKTAEPLRPEQLDWLQAFTWSDEQEWER